MSTIQQIQKRYMHAIDQARDESLSADARDRAGDDAVALRHELDTAIISQSSPGLSPDRARGIIGGMAANSAEMRELVRPVDPSKAMQQTATIDLRTEYPIAAGDSSNTYGSYGVPTGVASAVVMSLVDESAVLAAGPTILRTASGEPLNVPTLVTDATAGYRGEAQPATQSTPVMGKLPMTSYNLSGYVQVSSEFLSDALNGGADVFVGKLCGRALGIKLATELAVGDGSGHIDGLFNGATTGVTAASQSAITLDELRALRASVSASARRNARWVFADDAWLSVLQMKDDNANYIVNADPAGNDRLWGQPAFVDTYGPAMTTGKKVAVYGRLDNAYVVRFVGPMEITRSDEAGLTEFVSWLSTYRFQVRADAGWTTSDAKALELD